MRQAMSDELTPAGMEAVARPFAEPCARRLWEWANADGHTIAHVSRLDLKRVMQEYDRRGEELERLRHVQCLGHVYTSLGPPEQCGNWAGHEGKCAP